MKTIYLFLLSTIGIFYSLQLNAQILTSLPDSGAVWEYCECMQTWDFPGYTCYKFTISIGDSTQINGESYRKYYKVRAWHNDTTIQYLREDSTNKIYILRLPQNDTLEDQLYDFGANLGDSVITSRYHGTNIGRIDSLDTVFIANQFRKRYFVNTLSWSTGQTEIWIEGIGSTTDFLCPLETINTYDLWANILTFQDVDSGFYDSGDTCRYYNNIEETLSNYSINIYPNPTSNILNIKNNGINKIEGVSLYSMDGKEKLIKPLLSNQQSTIDVSTLTEGVYFLRLNVGGEIVFSKVIISH